jgi:large repetitive protein
MPLASGQHTVKAVAVEGAVRSADSNTNTFTVDTKAPDAPTVVQPADKSTTGNKPPISGMAEPGSTVTVRIDGQVVCVVVATPAGMYSCNLDTPLADGPHVIIAQATDAAGNVGPTSSPNGFTVVKAVNVPVIKVPAPGTFTGDTTPTFSGTAEPGAMVAVYIDGGAMPICTATADAQGKWSCDITTPLPLGPHVADAVATVGGVMSGRSTPVDFTIVTTTVTAPAANSSTTDRTPQYEGTAAPNSPVVVSVDGAEVCRVTSDAMGKWACKPTMPVLSVGPHVVRAVATVDGQPVPSADVPFNVIASVTTPVIESPTAGEVTGPRPEVRGTATPGTTVTVAIDGNQICSVEVPANGVWSCTPNEDLAPGDHTVTAVAADDSGVKSGVATVDFRVGVGGGYYAGGGVCSAGPTSAMLWMAALVAAAMMRRRSARRHA